jgi:hypothetical protein
MRHDDSITSGLAMSGVFVAVCNGCNFHITSHQSPVTSHHQPHKSAVLQWGSAG